MLTMYPNHLGLKRQQGSMVVISIFIIVIISLLAASLASLQRDSAEGASYEVYAARAYLSAYSASEIALVALFPLGSTEADESACIITDTTVSLGTDSGFHGCSASYQCEILTATQSASLPTRYKVVSTAVCANTQLTTRRQITLEAVEL